MACRGSAVRIRLAPFLKALPLEGFFSIWSDIFVRIEVCLARLLARKSDKTLRRSVISCRHGVHLTPPVACGGKQLNQKMSPDTAWVATTEASRLLGRSASFLKRLRDTHGGFLEAGKHYAMAPSSNAAITWNVSLIRD